jgi:hypothetical protein
MKHDGETFIQHNLENGTYKAYRFDSDEMVDSGQWSIDGTNYHEKDEEKNWKG